MERKYENDYHRNCRRNGVRKIYIYEKLKKEFKDDVAVLYHDNYYRDQSDIPLEE